MLHKHTVMKLLNIVALVIFILIMILSLTMAISGFCAENSVSSELEDARVYYDNGTVSGWATILAFIGIGASAVGGAVAAGMLILFGILGVVIDLIVYLPAFIARTVYKKNGNSAAYWILMALWFLPIAWCLVSIITY